MLREIRPVIGQEFLVVRTPVCDGKADEFDVWEPLKKMHSHGTISSSVVGHGWYGKVTTRNPDPDVLNVGFGEERERLVRAHFDNLYQLAYDLIEMTFPETVGKGSRLSGTIMLVREVQDEA